MKIPEYKALLKKKPKYRNESIVIDESYFPSKKQAHRFGDLRLLEKCGHIKDLRKEVDFSIDINGFHICKYRADAVYVDDSKLVVEDTKSDITRKLSVYRIKKKLMRAILNIQILET